MKLDAVFNRIRELTDKWFAGELSDRRFTEMVAGLINGLNAKEEKYVRN